MLTENHKYLTIPVYSKIHFTKPPVYIMYSDSIHSQSSVKILSKSGHHSMLRIVFLVSWICFIFCWHFLSGILPHLTQMAAGVASLQMYADKVFQKSVLTCMKVTACVLSLGVGSPVLESRLFQVCSTQWLISDLPSWWLGINSLRIIRSRLRDARNT